MSSAENKTVENNAASSEAQANDDKQNPNDTVVLLPKTAQRAVTQLTQEDEDGATATENNNKNDVSKSSSKPSTPLEHIKVPNEENDANTETSMLSNSPNNHDHIEDGTTHVIIEDATQVPGGGLEPHALLDDVDPNLFGNPLPIEDTTHLQMFDDTLDERTRSEQLFLDLSHC